MNSNCLRGMICPKCGELEPFKIAVNCWALVHDDGVEETHDVDWEDNDSCVCEKCGYAGKVSDFRVPSYGHLSRLRTHVVDVLAELKKGAHADHRKIQDNLNELCQWLQSMQTWVQGDDE